MSAATTHRIKERGGAGGRFTAAKPSEPLTPSSDKVSIGTAKNSTGKANFTANSRHRSLYQKPIIRPVPGIEKSSTCSSIAGVELKTRWSTSTATRGRSSSPSDFTRIFSHLRQNSASRDSLDRPGKENAKGLDGLKVLEKRLLGESNPRMIVKGNISCSKENINIGRKLVKSSERVLTEWRSAEDGKDLELTLKEGGKPINKVRSLNDCNKEPIFCLSAIQSTGVDSKCALDSGGDGCSITADCVSDNVLLNEKCGGKLGVLKSNGNLNVVKTEQQLGSKQLTVKDADALKEKGVNGEGVRGEVVDKCPSKLREKLAFLEGKVKRIASDIKRTNEMLDKNNIDASKMIILDIQEKISGIEKAMGDVIGDSDSNMGFHIGNGISNFLGKPEELNQNKQANITKAPGLNSVEIETRLFSHHKLQRDRTSLKGSSSGSQTAGSCVPKTNSESSLSGASLSPVDEDPIAVEFLASLRKEQPKTIVRDVVSIHGNDVQGTEDTGNSAVQQTSSLSVGKQNSELNLLTDERFDEFDDQENTSTMMVGIDTDDNNKCQLKEIGRKTCTAGWFVSEGESVLLAHDDGSCSFYDIINMEEKAEYKPLSGISPNVWRDCWIIRAPSTDGCSCKFVVAASAGNTMGSAFCSWDFYTKEVQAFHVEEKITNTRAVLGPITDNIVHRRNVLSNITPSENQQWWYKPCGPLIISAASCQNAIRVFDIRDGEQIMKWNVQKPVLAMDYSSPLQWRNRGKVVIAEADAVSLWDVSSLNPQALLSVSVLGRKVSAVHIHNTDAEVGGGVRQRVSSSEAEGNDGVFCTADSISILDFRRPSGVGLKIPKVGVTAQSVFSRGESIFLGCSTVTTIGKKQVCSQVQQFSLRKQKLVNTYVLPESDAHFHHTALTQVWGNSNVVMGVCGLGLFIFDALDDEGLPSFAVDYSSPQKEREIIGPDDLYSPSFDHLSSQILLISRDRPAMWRLLPQL
ncbi:hypothetical protein Nepgr_021765 [Nepenthes gracilis]|uniref:At4g14310 8-bladed propeller domain-containing protein n=1 Tax=Nepenthes gracilis TaxID=150966 RepID=A0AAD3SZT5_NEPGR|nr:hypothetical protein Nepgr_021765 [Nepenthes gracilis]